MGDPKENFWSAHTAGWLAGWLAAGWLAGGWRLAAGGWWLVAGGCELTGLFALRPGLIYYYYYHYYYYYDCLCFWWCLKLLL